MDRIGDWRLERVLRQVSSHRIFVRIEAAQKRGIHRSSEAAFFTENAENRVCGSPPMTGRKWLSESKSAFASRWQKKSPSAKLGVTC